VWLNQCVGDVNHCTPPQAM